MKILNHYIEKKSVSYVVDVDIKGFFDNVDHIWMMEFLKLRISDPNLLKIIGRFLKGGYMEEGVRNTKQIKAHRKVESYLRYLPIYTSTTFWTFGLRKRSGESAKGKHI